MTTCVLMVSRTFLSNHPKCGQQTGFIEKIKSGEKIHTIRMNYPLWRKIFDKIEAGEMCLSLRYWTGDPYRSKQEEFLRLTREDGIGVQKIGIGCVQLHDRKIFGANVLEDSEICQPFYVIDDIRNHPVIKYATNDGLTKKDFINWFAPYFEKEQKKYPLWYNLTTGMEMEFAVIHFTKFRY